MKNIIKKFDENGDKFAYEAIKEARKNKENITDYLLENVEKFAQEIDKNLEDCPLNIIYSVYLLAEFGEKRLFPILIKIFKNSELDPNNLNWFVFTDKLSSVIVSVFDGDLESINSIIEDKKVDEYIRESFLKCYEYFIAEGIVTEEECKAYLLKLIELYKDKEDEVFDAIQDIIAQAHLISMIDTVKELYKKENIDERMWGNYPDFLDRMFDYDNETEIHKITDFTKELGWFFKKYDVDEEEVTNTMVNFFDQIKKDVDSKIKASSKIGRNDPCPCGSGKKYKKCCIDKETKTLPYQALIDESLERYPKRKTDPSKYDLYDFYKEEYIELDKVMYKALMPRGIPLYVDRDILTETIIDCRTLKEAFKKIKAIIEKENIKTLKEYDEKVSIHFSIYEFIVKYGNNLMELIDSHYKDSEECVNDLTELVTYFEDYIEDNDSCKDTIYMYKNYLFLHNGQIDEAIEYFEEKLKAAIDFKYDIYDYLFWLYMQKYNDISKIDELINREKNMILRTRLQELKNEYLQD